MPLFDVKVVDNRTLSIWITANDSDHAQRLVEENDFDFVLDEIAETHSVITSDWHIESVDLVPECQHEWKSVPTALKYMDLFICHQCGDVKKEPKTVEENE